MLNNASLRFKLVLLSGLGIIMLLLTAITGTMGIRNGIDGVQEIGRNRLPSVLALQKIKELQIGLKSSTFEVALWENDAEAQDMFADIAKDKKRLWKNVDDAWKAYESIAKSSAETDLMEQIHGRVEHLEEDRRGRHQAHRLAGQQQGRRQTERHLPEILRTGWAATKILSSRREAAQSGG